MSQPFTISLLPLGRGTLALCRMPGAVTDLQTDIQALTDLGATGVLSLTPLSEMQAAGSQTLPEGLAACHLDWWYLPVADFGVPLPDQQEKWVELSRDLHARLDRGETLAIHCRAGLGRTGMIALRLMIEKGEGPQAALARLRAVRPGSVERPAQFDWAVKG